MSFWVEYILDPFKTNYWYCFTCPAVNVSFVTTVLFSNLDPTRSLALTASTLANLLYRACLAYYDLMILEAITLDALRCQNSVLVDLV